MLLHHLGAIDTTAEQALLTGDPDRVDLLVDALGKESERWARRGYVCAEAETDAGPVLICSTGIGGPSAAIAIEELGQLGVSRFVRVGTCGSLQQHVGAGDLVLSTACVRDEGTSRQYLPASYPAAASFGLLRSMAEHAAMLGVRHHIGVTHAKDAYYAEDPQGQIMSTEWHPRWAALRAAGVLATEMEAAALFAIATVRDWRAAAVYVAVEDHLTPGERNGSLRAAARIARYALADSGPAGTRSR
jgi:uridine phosphorylase